MLTIQEILQQHNGFNSKVRSKMAQKVKRMNHFSRLDTIMEATQREESDNGDCFHLELSQKSSNGWDSVASKNIEDVETSRRTGNVVSSTRICRSEQRRHERSALPHNVSSVEYLFRTKQDHSSEMTQKDIKNARDVRQGEILFPEFFSSRASTTFIQQSDWHDNNQQKNMVLVNEKVKEDPFIRSWLNLFGACSCT